ncbi:MAG: low molecular weight protein arginine phosphatase [Eubacteriales bacterium]|nr:low molecular weight protein arginine phosphatase [Bacillota bacterium]MDP3050134.1 low molecular weight protein arginine phosphatase [Eubacteriales bacterium]MDQ7789887.1 low molecular weight protein arginine phosphatase [Clostridia bacterium]MDZ4043932.1 low molecular weight protein arginine phosphatase [Eubacteriales bacterium]MDZ7609930.1 low molecular weight protein arginine phosphatase [Eubacteriales bacterium]
MITILFVCTGNTCRSPMAAGLARHLLAQGGELRVQVLSAGVWALPGAKATEEAVEALAEQGIDISEHRSTMLTADLIEQADVVLTMTATHKQNVLQAGGQAEHKVFTIGEYARMGGDLADPFGGSLAVYRQYAARLEILIKLGLKRLKGEINRTGQDNHGKM